MRVLIVEDEKIASEKLKMLLTKVDGVFEIVDAVTSIKDAVKTIEDNRQIDLGFFDIELADGLSFSIFEKVKVEFPVIFTTAFNQYAIQAFKHNSIDYILKPIQLIELKSAINKFEKNWKTNYINENILAELKTLMSNKFKERFAVKVGEHIKMTNVKDICCFYSYDKGTFLLNFTGNNYLLDYSLDSLNDILSPELFFRVNRQYIVNINAIKDIVSYTNSRLKLKLSCTGTEDIIVSREKVKEFKSWIDK